MWIIKTDNNNKLIYMTLGIRTQIFYKHRGLFSLLFMSRRYNSSIHVTDYMYVLEMLIWLLTTVWVFLQRYLSTNFLFIYLIFLGEVGMGYWDGRLNQTN